MAIKNSVCATRRATVAIIACAFLTLAACGGGGSSSDDASDGSDDNTVILWNTQIDTLWTLHGHGDLVRSVAFSPSGDTLASGSDDETIRLWSVKTGALLDSLDGITPLPDSSTDIDRNGSAEVDDILRTMDLLNGGGSYSAWFGQSLGVCPS